MASNKPEAILIAPVAEPAAASSVPRSLQESPQRWWIAVLLNLGLLFCYMHRSALSVAAPSMITDLGLSMAATGVLLSAFFWPYSILQMPAGWLVDRYGVRKTYAIGFLLGSLATAATGLASGMAALIGVRALLGVGQSAVFPASSRATANSFHDRERGFATSFFLAGNRLGQALINGVGPMLLVAVGWQMFFSGLGLLPLLFLAPWLLFLRRWEQPAARPAKKKEFSLLEGLALLKQPTTLGIFLGFFAYDYVWFLYLSWLPAYLRIERKCTPTEMAIFSAVPYIVGLVVTLAAGALSDWFVRQGRDEIRVRKLFIIVGLAIACLIVPAGLVEDKMTAVWLLTLSLCGLNIAAPNSWSLTQAASEKRIVGTVAGIQNFGGNIGGVIAPALTGYIAGQTHSFALALGLAGVILIGGILSYWFLIGEKVSLETPASGGIDP
jgi:MFS transporter, ACS family, D-galactonate transporter